MPAETRKTIPRADCPHLAELRREVQSDKTACEECGLPGPLRRCLSCGYVGCCESFGAHDTEHARQSGHASSCFTAWLLPDRKSVASRTSVV